MSTNTTNYNLKKPGVDDFYNVADQNGNMDTIDATLANKVDKVAGKGLSTNDYTTFEKTKLSGIETGAEVNNISDANATDLTDGTDTTLHTHATSGITGFAAAVRGMVLTGLSTATNSVITATDTILTALGKLQAQITAMMAVKTATITTTWTGSSAPYTQMITVTGITANDEPIISPVYSTTLATALLEKEAWSMISKIETAAGSIVVTCFEDKPVTVVNIQIKGV
ncbi:Uncharacterised protein [Acetobacterium wieringae]|uniref:hypothetical protein n=1 Tax=Acetobacterium wieringae TaxID=52694 RepID=UPI001D4AFCC6|nr:hypothetical protein [Acetobacterium wieringae]VUZ28544.1 Uncharacterised protein [Acetobacterium wieringae]